MRCLESFLWDPVLVLLGEVLECVLLLGFDAGVTLPQLPGLVVIVARVHVPDAALGGVQGQLPEVRKLLRLRQHLNQPLIIRLVVLDLKEGGTFTFPGHNHFIQLSASLLELSPQLSYQSILPVHLLLLPLEFLHVDVIHDVHLLEFLLSAADLSGQPPHLLLTGSDIR